MPHQSPDREKIRILLCGVGAVGMLVASKFARTPGIEFKILAAELRKERLERDGMFLNGTRYDFDIVPPSETNFRPDLILLAVKSHALREAGEMLKNFVRKETVLLPLLNGISAKPFLNSLYPECCALYGFFLGHASVRTGNKVEQDGVGCFYFGDTRKESEQAVAFTGELFDKAAIRYEIPSDIQERLWRKYILNVGVNQTSALFRADYGAMQRTPEYMLYAETLMREGVSIAARLGINHTETMLESAMSVILSMPPDVKTSMLQDVEQERPTEKELFSGELCRLGRELGIPTPANDEVFNRLP